MNALAGIDVDLLLALDALLKTGNVTRASEQLGISQPALSARLTRLRAVLGDRLFIPSPTGRGVLPTPRALSMSPRVSQILQQLTAMLEPDVFKPDESRRVFTVAMHENPSVMLGPDLVRMIQSAAPGVRLRFAVPEKSQMAALLETGAVDVFVGVSEGADEAWIARPLFEDEFLTAQRKGHPRGLGPMTLDEFCTSPHLLVSGEGEPFSGFVDRALEEQGRVRTVAVSIQNYAAAPAFIAGSEMLCTLPQRLLQRFSASLDLFLPPISFAPVQVRAYWHPRYQDDPAHQWLRSRLFAAAGIATQSAAA